MPELSNEELAEQFLELAQLLEQQGANPYRAGAYRSAAQTLQQEPRPANEILQKARKA